MLLIALGIRVWGIRYDFPQVYNADEPWSIGIAYQMLWFIGFVAIAARVFSSDRILTMKLKIGRRR